MCEYIICGMPSKVYARLEGNIDLVSEGTNVIWKRCFGTYFMRATLSKSPFSSLLLLEIEVSVRRSKPLDPVKGLKPKHNRNKFCKDFKYFVKEDGRWQPFEKNGFIALRKGVIEQYMRLHPEKNFDESFIGFYETCPQKPLEQLNISKNLSFQDSYRFALTAYTKLMKNATAVIYDINHDPSYVFEEMTHAFTSSFKSLTPKYKYVIVRIKDGEQDIWSQVEDGAGCVRIYIYEHLDEKLLHLVLDSTKQRNKYYEHRSGYWYEIEAEEHISLLNIYVKTFMDIRLVYEDEKYILKSAIKTEDDDDSVNL